MAGEARVLLVDAGPDEATWAESRLRLLEARWSRFLPTSDLSRLNRSGGGRHRVHPDLITLVETMRSAARLTGGRYDPTMLCEIIDAGYAASIDDPRRVSIAVDLPSIGHSVHDILVDRHGSAVHLPPGLGLDPGGIGKGLAADIVVAELLQRGAAGALVAIGGDMAFAGASPYGDDWHVTIADPFNADGELVRIGVSAGGVATSSTRTRRWQHAGRLRHHVLDPVGRGQSSTDLAAVTVVASSGWQAEALATAAILGGSDGAGAVIERDAVAGLAVVDDGRMLTWGSIRVGEASAVPPVPAVSR